MDYDWNFRVVIQSLPFLLSGLKYTILVSVLSMFFGSVLGLFITLARQPHVKWINRLSQIYVGFFRGTPLLMQLLWAYYSLPMITGIALSSVTTGVLALSLNLSAFISEIFRAGIQSIGRDQRDAALALGMNGDQVLRRIVLPQALRRIIPPLGSVWVSLFKDTSLVSVVVIKEMTYQANALNIETYRPVEVYTVLAVLYFLLTYPQARLVDLIYARFRVSN